MEGQSEDDQQMQNVERFPMKATKKEAAKLPESEWRFRLSSEAEIALCWEWEHLRELSKTLKRPLLGTKQWRASFDLNKPFVIAVPKSEHKRLWATIEASWYEDGPADLGVEIVPMKAAPMEAGQVMKHFTRKGKIWQSQVVFKIPWGRKDAAIQAAFKVWLCKQRDEIKTVASTRNKRWPDTRQRELKELGALRYWLHCKMHCHGLYEEPASCKKAVKAARQTLENIKNWIEGDLLERHFLT